MLYNKVKECVKVVANPLIQPFNPHYILLVSMCVYVVGVIHTSRSTRFSAGVLYSSIHTYICIYIYGVCEVRSSSRCFVCLCSSGA